jgi:putative nucleotidyltransferase with HDIG domain
MMAEQACSASGATPGPPQGPQTGVAANPSNRERDACDGLCKLPVFRPVALKLMKLTSDDDASLSEITNLLEADPGLSAEVLALANSPLWGNRSTIHSLTRAITQVGWKRTESLIMTVALRAFVNGSPKTAGLVRTWRHSFSSALLAEDLAGAQKTARNEAYTAGLLHDIGRLGMLAAYPERYGPLLDAEYDCAEQAGEAERQALGMDHCQAGRMLAERWGFPEELQQAAGSHHQPGTSGLQRLVASACRLSTALGFGVLQIRQSPGPDDLISQLPLKWSRRGASGAEDLRQWIDRKLDSLDLG